MILCPDCECGIFEDESQCPGCLFVLDKEVNEIPPEEIEPPEEPPIENHLVEIDLTAPNHGKITVNGKDVAGHVTRISMEAVAGEIPVVALSMAHGGKVHIKGEVFVFVASYQIPYAVWEKTIVPLLESHKVVTKEEE